MFGKNIVSYINALKASLSDIDEYPVPYFRQVNCKLLKEIMKKIPFEGRRASREKTGQPKKAGQ